MKKIFTLIFIFVSYTSFSQVRISQVYGAGGNASATYNADFVELFNSGTSAASLSGYSIQYASATGTSWSKFDLPAISLLSGQYFLIQMSTVGATGIALPTPDATASPAIAMSGTAGKVALVNSITALTGTQCPPPFVATIIDFVGYGATANCYEGTGPTPIPVSNANSLTRIASGCTDNNDNATDFTAIIASARNTVSPLNPCGAPVPTLVAGPAITNITTNAGIESAPQSFTLSGFFLTGFTGNISVTASANFEVSLTSGSGYAPSINVPFTSATLNATTIYVHIIAAAPQGALTGTVTCSGGGAASNAVVNLTGGVFQNYYNTKANLGLTNTGTWSTTTNGSGASPANFTNPYQLFNIINQANANYTGIWDVSTVQNSSRIIVGDGSAVISLTVLPGIDSITSATRIDVSNNATLVIQNNRRPFLNNLATGSTINFAQTGLTTTDTIKVPALSYHNLIIKNGIKVLSSGTTTIRGKLTIDGVINFNGAPSPFSTINCFGNIDLLNGTTFEPFPSGDNARITLAMNGTSQNILTAGNDILLFRLRRDTISVNGTIQFSGTPVSLVLGNASGGGLQLNQGVSTLTSLDLGANSLTLTGAGVSTSTSLGKITMQGGNVNIQKQAGATNAGTLRFESGDTEINNFTMNMDPAVTRDSITIADDVSMKGILTLTKGRIVMTSGKKFTLTAAATVTGGSATSFVDGILGRTGSTAFTYHVGKANKYAPVEFTNITGGNSYNVQYFNGGYGNYTINPATLSGFPNYNVSKLEWWKIDQVSAGSVDLTFNYTDINSQVNVPSAIRMAHFGSVDWNDLGGVPGVANTTAVGNIKITGVSSFSPFTFGATAIGVIPVKLNSFTVQKLHNTVKLNWSTSQEINSKEFIIERSANGTNWVAIATIPAASNSQTKLYYSTTDLAPVKGINFYRIKQVDVDAKFDYSATKSILFNAAYEVLITPNPATGFINIYLDKNNNSSVNIQLLDASGKLIRSVYSDQPNVQMNTVELGRGIYFVKIIDGEHVTVRKILLQ